MSEKTKSVLKLIFYSAIIIIIASIGSMGSGEYYNSLKLPVGAPPSWLFPVMWGILYSLMIIAASLILVKVKDGMYKKDALSYYYTQLIVNALWPYLFFSFKLSLLAFLWLVLLFALAVITLIKFYKLYKASGLMLIPYALWIIYAGYINLFVAILN